mmetsp:Transcript_39874/g.95701  ORF Transcript_39874/g.95701 Transcript_39874/m.95701 type:complete len:298 (+) Transcript_39874:398-1291(+)
MAPLATLPRTMRNMRTNPEAETPAGGDPGNRTVNSVKPANWSDIVHKSVNFSLHSSLNTRVTTATVKLPITQAIPAINENHLSRAPGRTPSSWVGIVLDHPWNTPLSKPPAVMRHAKETHWRRVTGVLAAATAPAPRRPWEIEGGMRGSLGNAIQASVTVTPRMASPTSSTVKWCCVVTSSAKRNPRAGPAACMLNTIEVASVLSSGGNQIAAMIGGVTAFMGPAKPFRAWPMARTVMLVDSDMPTADGSNRTIVPAAVKAAPAKTVDQTRSIRLVRPATNGAMGRYVMGPAFSSQS